MRVWMLRKLSIPVLSALLGILFTHLFNPIAWIPIVPKDHVYDICTGIYFAVIDILLNESLDWAEKKFRSEITLTISGMGTSAPVDSDQEINLNSSGMAELQVMLRLRGKRKHLSGMKIVIPVIGFATIQPASGGQGINLDTDGNCVIHLDSLLGLSEDVEIDRGFRLVVSMTPSGMPQSERICPCAEGLKWNVRFKCNKAIIRIGR